MAPLSHVQAGRGSPAVPRPWPFTATHLLPALAAHGGGLGLELENGAKQGKCLILGKGDVGIVMQTEDLRHVIERKALDVGEVALGSKKAETDWKASACSAPAYCCFWNGNGL